MKNILNRRLLIAIFLCAVIVCGLQLAFAEPVSAAKYKKFDSGKLNLMGFGSIILILKVKIISVWM